MQESTSPGIFVLKVILKLRRRRPWKLLIFQTNSHITLGPPMLVQEVRKSRINCALLSLCFRLYPGVMSNSPIFRVQVMRFSVPRCRVQGYRTCTLTRFARSSFLHTLFIHSAWQTYFVSLKCISQKIDKFYQLLVLKWGMIWVNQMKPAVSMLG